MNTARHLLAPSLDFRLLPSTTSSSAVLIDRVGNNTADAEDVAIPARWPRAMPRCCRGGRPPRSGWCLHGASGPTACRQGQTFVTHGRALAKRSTSGSRAASRMFRRRARGGSNVRWPTPMKNACGSGQYYKEVSRAGPRPQTCATARQDREPLTTATPESCSEPHPGRGESVEGVRARTLLQQCRTRILPLRPACRVRAWSACAERFYTALPTTSGTWWRALPESYLAGATSKD